MFLTLNDHLVQVTPQGGSVTDWLWRDQRILGPATQRVTGQSGTGAPLYSLRGVSHWCFPNFGRPPDTDEWRGFPQHGYLRDTLLSPTQVNRQRVEFMGRVQNGHLPGTNLIMGVSLAGGKSGSAHLIMQLAATVCHDEPPTARVPVLPGLHPYFYVGGDQSCVEINGRTIPASAQSTKVEAAGPAVVHLPAGDVQISATHCRWFVVWSDDPSQYLCVEPVFYGKPGTFGTDQAAFLTPTSSVDCLVSLLFTPR